MYIEFKMFKWTEIKKKNQMRIKISLSKISTISEQQDHRGPESTKTRTGFSL